MITINQHLISCSFEEYVAFEGCNNSFLTNLKKSPLHAKHEQDHAKKDSSSLAMGRLVHDAILEPLNFAKKYHVLNVDSRTKEGKDMKQRILNAHKIPIKPSDVEGVKEMTEQIYQHPAARELLHGALKEVSIRFELDGFPCKARLDGYHADGKLAGVVMDLKTTRDASPEAFKRTMFSYGYHRQAAWYLQGLRTLGLPATSFYIVAVETTAPYAVAVYRVSDKALEVGLKEVNQLFSVYKECKLTNEWHGYSREAQLLELPYYANENKQLLLTEF